MVLPVSIDQGVHRTLPCTVAQVGSQHLAPLAGFLILAAGCGAQSVVANRFSEQAACPRSRVTVTQHPFHPPPEIAADPERLKIYINEQVPVFQARGCDTERFYMCVWSGSNQQNICSQGSTSPPPPGAKFPERIPE